MREPEINDLGIRFYGSTDDEGVRKIANYIKTRGMGRPVSRTRLHDRHASAAGAWHIDKDMGDDDVPVYSLRQTTMGAQSTFYSSTDLNDVVRHSADEVGYDDEDYDPRDWDE